MPFSASSFGGHTNKASSPNSCVEVCELPRQLITAERLLIGSPRDIP